MRLANLAGRLVVLQDRGVADLARASSGRFSTMADALDQWPEFREWVARAALEFRPMPDVRLGPPVPRPGQVFGVGLNYLSHLREAGRPTDRAQVVPLVFTKFPSALCGHRDTIALHGEFTDWEVELVAVIGTEARNVKADEALAHVAGYMVGQDLSDRAVQRAGQLSPGKSFATYAPCGPWMLTSDDVPDPQDLSARCLIGDEIVQQFNTRDMLYSVAELIELLSCLTTLRPGDLIFTGTGSGVGVFRDPPRFLRPGEVLTSAIGGLGEMTNPCALAPEPVGPIAAMWRMSLEMKP